MNSPKSEPAEQPREENTVPGTKKLYRLPKQGKIAGVCAGLADFIDMDVTIMRIIFVILTIASGGFGLIVYLILAIVMPVSDKEAADLKSVDGIGENISSLATEIKEGGGVNRLRNYFGVTLVLFGAWLLLVQLFPEWIDISWELIWPTALVVIGLALVAKART